MPWLHFISWFCGGMFLSNAVPHFVNGISGRPFQSPFASPPGKGLSSSTVNVLWGAFNALAGYCLVLRAGAFNYRSSADVAAVGAGALVMALMMARYFGRYHGGNLKRQS